MIDKCLCIKDYCNEFNKSIFKEGKIYEYTDQKFIKQYYPKGYNVYFSKGEYIYFTKYQNMLGYQGYRLFSTYFKTLKQIRKEKLNKLNV